MLTYCNWVWAGPTSITYWVCSADTTEGVEVLVSGTWALGIVVLVAVDVSGTTVTFAVSSGTATTCWTTWGFSNATGICCYTAAGTSGIVASGSFAKVSSGLMLVLLSLASVIWVAAVSLFSDASAVLGTTYCWLSGIIVTSTAAASS